VNCQPTTKSTLKTAVSCFLPDSTIDAITPLGHGNINDTYLIAFTDHPRVVLQRINHDVFPEPARVAQNTLIVTEHIRQTQRSDNPDTATLQVLPTESGECCHVDERGCVWRMLNFIEDTVTYSAVHSGQLAYEGGRMLGRFHHSLETLTSERLALPLPGFHDLPSYGRIYRHAVSSCQRASSAELSFCCREADIRLNDCDKLEAAAQSGRLLRRIIHGDPKLNNILFERKRDRAVVMIDLDTVAPGLLQYDLGDCLRSFCNTAGEQPEAITDVTFDLDICRMVLTGYCSSGAHLSENERDMIYQGVRLLTYELGLRFLTDYLEGNRYFKVSDDQENLYRAMVQFKLLHSIEMQRSEIETISRQLQQ